VPASPGRTSRALVMAAVLFVSLLAAGVAGAQGEHAVCSACGAELHTVPRISLVQAERELRVGTLTEYAAGLRFYPVPILGLDATAAVDEEAVGLADIEIGFGLHVTLGPRREAPAPAPVDK
jgi:hypothetical protein